MRLQSGCALFTDLRLRGLSGAQVREGCGGQPSQRRDNGAGISYGRVMHSCKQRLACAFIAFMAIASSARAAEQTHPGCGATGTASGTFTLSHHGVTRTYRLHLPPGHHKASPRPLVIVFHGWGGDENEFLSDPAVTREADARGYILVAPRGLGAGPPDDRNNSWTFRGSASGIAGPFAARTNRDGSGAICDARVTPDYRYPSCANGAAQNSCSWTQCQDDDVDFVIELVKRLNQTACVDTARVFATGGSNGGMFVWELGQNPASVKLFRAIAPVIGLPHRGYQQGPANRAGMPVMLITGTQDNTVPPGSWEDDRFTTTSNGNDRFYYTGATAITRRWARAAGCDIRHPARTVDTGTTEAECRSYCTATPGQWPAVMDCRAPMGHDYGLPWSWKLIMDFFDRS